MAYSPFPKHKHAVAGALMIAHLVTCFLASWFHQHADQDHAEVKGEFYHSHVSAVASQAQEIEQDHHASPDGLHLLEGAQPFENMQTALAVQFGQSFTPGKFAPQNDFFGLPSAGVSPPTVVVKTALKLPSVRSLLQNYFVLIAAGLSPPALA